MRGASVEIKEITDEMKERERRDWKARIGGYRPKLSAELAPSETIKFINSEDKPPQTITNFTRSPAGEAVVDAVMPAAEGDSASADKL